MRILLGCSSPPDVGAGGILTYTREIAESLMESGHEVCVAAPKPSNWEWIKHYNISFHETSQYDDPLQSVQKLISYIEDANIDAIINNDNPYVQSMLPVAKCPSIVIGHLGESVIASLACYQQSWTDYVVAISNDMYSTYVQKFGIPVTKCPIVFNGVKDYGCNEDLSNNSEKLKVVFAGGYNKRKGCLHVLSTVRKHYAKLDNVELNWFGSVPDKVREELVSYGFVKFRGQVARNEFLEFMKDADVLLFPSKSEGCPMAMLEAMSFGVVPIASNGIGAMQSLILNGEHGYTCHLNNWHNQAADCLNFLNKNRKFLSDMKSAVRSRYLQKFQRVEVTDRLIQLINQPTVSRDEVPNGIDVLHWHRPVPIGKTKSTFFNRIRFRLGLLRKAGRLAPRY